MRFQPWMIPAGFLIAILGLSIGTGLLFRQSWSDKPAADHNQVMAQDENAPRTKTGLIKHIRSRTSYTTTEVPITEAEWQLAQKEGRIDDQGRAVVYEYEPGAPRHPDDPGTGASFSRPVREDEDTEVRVASIPGEPVFRGGEERDWRDISVRQPSSAVSSGMSQEDKAIALAEKVVKLAVAPEKNDEELLQYFTQEYRLEQLQSGGLTTKEFIQIWAKPKPENFDASKWCVKCSLEGMEPENMARVKALIDRGPYNLDNDTMSFYSMEKKGFVQVRTYDVMIKERGQEYARQWVKSREALRGRCVIYHFVMEWDSGLNDWRVCGMERG